MSPQPMTDADEEGAGSKMPVTWGWFRKILVDLTSETKAHVERAQAPLTKRLDALEKATLDVSASYDGRRSITLRFTQGERVKEQTFAMPVVIDCGVYREGGEYHVGDGVTDQGSYWIALGMTRDRPGTSGGWRLAVKKGRDGKDVR
jgi:hypothetical protein